MDLKSATDFTLSALQHHQPPAGKLNAVVSKMMRTLSPQVYSYRLFINSKQQIGVVGVYDRWIVTLKPNPPDAIQVAIHDIEAQRSQELAVEIRSKVELNAAIEAWHEKIEWWRTRLSVYRLQPDSRYRVIQPFKDYYGNTFEANATLTYAGQNFLPYSGGYTISFKEATLYLQETDNAALLNDFDAYVEEIE